MSSVYATLRSLTAAIGLLTCAAATPSSAGVIYESAAYSGIDFGDYILSSDDFIGAAFQLTSTTAITGIGAQFGANNGGTIFGTIVPLASLSAFPAVQSNNLSSISLADVVFSVPNGTAALDLVEPLVTTLGPGAYGVIFGAGHFGSSAAGFAGLGGYNTTTGTPTLFRSLFSPDWVQFDDNIRIVVEGTALSAVPLPAGLPLFATGLTFLGFLGWRRQRRGNSSITSS